jgi:hypothetical protein
MMVRNPFAVLVAATAASCASHAHGPASEGGGSPPVALHTNTPAYPDGPYGFEIGSTFPNVTVQGYVAGAAPWGPITTKDYYDPDGSKGIRGFYLTVSAPWCAGCVMEGQDLPGLYTAQYRKRGARILTVLLEGPSHEPSSQGTVDTWVATYGTPYDVAIGSGADVLAPAGAPGAALGLPWNYVIDPRTMKIAAIDSGTYFSGDSIPGLDPVLAKNAPP